MTSALISGRAGGVGMISTGPRSEALGPTGSGGCSVSTRKLCLPRNRRQLNEVCLVDLATLCPERDRKICDLRPGVSLRRENADQLSRSVFEPRALA